MSYKPKQIEAKDIEIYEINMSSPDSYLFIKLPEECGPEYAKSFVKNIKRMMKPEHYDKVVVYSGDVEFKQVEAVDE